MTLRTIHKLCRLLSMGSIVLLIASLLLSSSTLMYMGVLGTFGHAMLNLKSFRCPYCNGRLATIPVGSNCPDCNQPLNWD